MTHRTEISTFISLLQRPMLASATLALSAACFGQAAMAGNTFRYSFVDTYDEVCGAEDDSEGCAEISAYDPVSSRIFTINGQDNSLRVLELLDGYALRDVARFSLKAFGALPNSVAAKNGMVAVALEAEVKQDTGSVVLLDASTLEVLATVPAGALPDMVTFTPDGRYILVANEGEPNADYSNDPEGSITVINTSDFTARQAEFNNFTNLADSDVRIFGPGATVAQDLEPEYITVSRDSGTAWISLQENNALATLDVESATITAVTSLGLKDHSDPANALDSSDRDGGEQCAFALEDPEQCINIQPHKVFGMYMPDAIASYSVDGSTYIITANEGDSRDYDGYSEELRIGDDEYVLDPVSFPNARELKDDAKLGRLKVSSASGDIDGDGDFDVINIYGARSFSIWNSDAELVFDSGSQFENILADLQKNGVEVWNDSRSDDKGPEPESIALGELSGRQVAFIGLERSSGIFVYDISNPKLPSYLGYMNTRMAGDISPEGLVFVANQADSSRGVLIVTNELSNTTSTYRVSLTASTGTGTSVAPVVSGTLITWQSDDIYQVQTSTTYETICEGASLGRCEVEPGSYNVINLTTGERFENIEVTAESAEPVVSNHVISWKNSGYWQVQTSDTYTTVCEGNNLTHCTVESGVYNVINHTSGQRFEKIVVQ